MLCDTHAEGEARKSRDTAATRASTPALARSPKASADDEDFKIKSASMRVRSIMPSVRARQQCTGFCLLVCLLVLCYAVQHTVMQISF